MAYFIGAGIGAVVGWIIGYLGKRFGNIKGFLDDPWLVAFIGIILGLIYVAAISR